MTAAVTKIMIMMSSTNLLLFFVCLTLFLLANVVVIAVEQHSIVTSLANDLLFDENSKLTSHQLLYPSGFSQCPASSFHVPEGFEAHGVKDIALKQLFPDIYAEGKNALNPCQAVCVERGVDQSIVHAVMPHRKFIPGRDGDNFDEWFDLTCRQVEVCLMNYHSKTTPIQLWWIRPEDQVPVFHLDIGYGERHTRCFKSFIGHSFQARDGETGEVLEILPIEYTTVKAFGESPPSSTRRPGHSFRKEIEDTLNHEWFRHNRVTRTFSSLGFKKGRLPDDVFASMSSFYYNNRHHNVREEWGGKGVFVNWWETDCTFIQIPWGIKAIWQDRLRQLVEAWAGVAVEQTDMYGLRQYQEGARLLTHVDRHQTHAVSLIVNIAQGNLTEPWPVEVQDHGDRLHEVIMEPGDIVYYESAKALHGRNRPLRGPHAYYVNLFTHYRPTGDPDWFGKPNDPHVPDPVIEIQGECRLEAAGTTSMGNQQLGIVQAVKCDDERLGPYISPTLFQAHSGADLIEWWKYTSPPNVILTVEEQKKQSEPAAAQNDEL